MGARACIFRLLLLLCVRSSPFVSYCAVSPAAQELSRFSKNFFVILV